jgi:HD-GYP domain-containing protein (c-di-GMP phosphodiesterase class II)
VKHVSRPNGISGSSHSPEREEALVVETRSRSLSRPELRESIVGASMALGFVVSAVLVAAAWWPTGDVSVVACIAGVLALALASRAGFEIGRGAGVPTQLVFVPMLFLLPTGLAPLLVMAAYVLERLASRDWRKRLLRLHITVGSCWFALGPAIVLGLAGSGLPSWSRWPVYLLAIVAQIGIDLVTSSLSEWLVFGQPPLTTSVHVVRASLIDVALSPAGIALAIAGRGTIGYALLAGLPLIMLLKTIAEDRETRIGQANELGEAYEGTAMLLGDVVEADDEYTGSHTRGVVWLVERVSEKMQLGIDVRRDAKLAAILHDVGKIRIPDAIINKPGKLTDEEFAIIQTHTIEGQKLLTRVGGLLADVGVIVRSCHERWDGAGYPDQLAGAAIPLPARIVCVCDAFNAMITDRPYRARRTTEEALAELDRCAGTHFDPRVVAATVAVVTEITGSEGSDEALQWGQPLAA